MMFNKFSQFVLRGRRQAIGVALLFSMLPLFSWVSVVIVGLITLCKGPYEGFLVFLWAALPYVVIAVKGEWLPLVLNVALGSLLVWLFAVMLRRYAKWLWVLEGLSLFAVVAIIVAHFTLPSLHTWWTAKMLSAMQMLEGYLGGIALSADQLKPIINMAAQFATGVQACYVIITVLVELSFARMLQARLFSTSGRLRKEWLQLRLDYYAVVVFVVITALAIWGPILFKDIVPVVVLPFLIVGIGVIQGFFSRVKPSLIWLFYLVVLVVAMILPLIFGGFLVAFAILDALLPLRDRSVGKLVSGSH